MGRDLSVVTGATGHLGNVLVRELLAQNRPVRAVLAPGDDATPLDGLPVERVTADVRDAGALTRAFEGADVVFHLAAVVSITRGQDALMEAVNVGGVRAVLEACRAAGVRRLVHTGSVHALVEPPGGLLKEEAGFDPARAAGPYARTKALACREVQAAARRGELDAVIVLPTGVVGPWDFRLSELGQLVLALRDGRVPALLEGGHDLVDVRDVALGTVAAARSGRRGEAYLLSGEHVPLQRLACWVHDATGARVPPVVPRGLAGPVAWAAPVYERLTGRRALLTRYALHAVSAPFAVSHARASQELGFAPRPVERSVRDALAWHAARAVPIAVPGPGRQLVGAAR